MSQINPKETGKDVQEKAHRILHHTKESYDNMKDKTQEMVGSYVDYAERSPLIRKYGYGLLILSAIPIILFVGYAGVVILGTVGVATAGSITTIGAFLGVGSLVLLPVLLTAAFIALLGLGTYQSFKFGIDILRRFYQWVYPKAEAASETAADTARQVGNQAQNAANQAH
ncbi:hypothetical protein K493DRAFT_304164 [Basidiobolus meristosporus CBS 931.73]|uniref:Uncharacterized protein n=1 Tax=Basidiobolus meristosporus CBS 931.73 TaxID=1314790 RepID=A0A1Y1Y0Y9_9FUNG|nr:hypothetical protein K493DRAFT_304164 [Basidiobolus meristosporus CBS 931.73]|eukprot:ORX91294.1 hypothetical protein K493DRAFT_304164 [Basidiobolus meristosporus CBS 931.73]